jgi:LmbE family N-acetylglucosaminyl deacetylase
MVAGQTMMGQNERVSRNLTLMMVHAHPDDEVIPTGGLLARSADEGITTVLVTCTDGSQGFGPEFVNSGEPGHDPAMVANVRRVELERSCEALGVTHSELLGYRDSGMEGWDSNHDPSAFCQADLNEAAQRLATLIERYRPDVLVTYANNGGSGHPDHVNAHLITLLADDLTKIARKVYFVIRSSAFTERVRIERELITIENQKPESGRPVSRQKLDHLVTTVVDTSTTIARKKRALHAHQSQLHGSHWVYLSDEALERIFHEETYIRARDKTGSKVPETDVFAGLRTS